MFIWKLEQTNSQNTDDFYESCIVVSESEEKAKKIHPGRNRLYDEETNSWYIIDPFKQRMNDDSWALDSNEVEVTKLGVAEPFLKEGEILSYRYIEYY